MGTKAVHVRLFASLRDLAGASEVDLELTSGDSVESCWVRLCQRFDGLAAWRSSVRPARNLEYVDWDELVGGGDELAFLPPVSGGTESGGARIAVRVGPEPIDDAQFSSAIQRSGIGAIATFIGLVRDPDGGRKVRRLIYEAYPEMAEPVLTAICVEACDRFAAQEARVQHRTGEVLAGETSVAVAVGAAHRHQALDACGYIIDELKSRAPIWKAEE